MTRGRSVIRAQRTWIGGSFRPAAIVVERGLVAGIVDVAGSRGRRRAPCWFPTTRCSCPASSTRTCTSTSRAAPSGRASAPPPLAAAAGGVTTIVDMPLNSLPPTTTPAALEVKRAAAAPSAFIDVGFWGGAVPENLGALAPAARRRRLRVQVLPLAVGRRRVPAPRPCAARSPRRRDRGPRRRGSSCTPRTRRSCTTMARSAASYGAFLGVAARPRARRRRSTP